MTDKRKRKLDLLIIKLAECKSMMKDLGYNTDKLTDTLTQVREIKEKNDPTFYLDSSYSVYAHLVELDFLINNLQVYKKSETKLNKIKNKFEGLKDKLEDKPQWKIETYKETEK